MARKPNYGFDRRVRELEKKEKKEKKAEAKRQKLAEARDQGAGDEPAETPEDGGGSSQT